MDLVHPFDERAVPADLGGKGSNLVRLRAAGFPVPDGFCMRAAAYQAFIEANDLGPALNALAATPGLRQPTVARDAAAALAPLMQAATAPESLELGVREAFRRLRERTRPDLRVAVRSSSLSEDSAGASSAGQYESYLQIGSEDELLEALLRCLRSLWSYRAIQYRAIKGLDGRREAMAVVVMEMVPAEVAGVAFSVNPVTGNTNEIMINASWGLGESVVSGIVTPDNYLVDKSSLRIVTREVAAKDVEIVPHPAGRSGTVKRSVPPERAARAALAEEAVLDLAQICRRIEEHYGRPQDIEWALHNGQFFIVQARPVTTLGPGRTEE